MSSLDIPIFIAHFPSGIGPHPEPPHAQLHSATQPQTKRPRRELGMTVSGGGYIVPDAVRDKFAKWEVHVPLTYLTDRFCSSQPTAQSSLADFLAVVDGQVTTKSKSLSTVGELDMTFDEWHQAWQRLLKLIDQYHPDELALWRTHYMSIMIKETRGEDWLLWLAYDTEVRRRSVTSPLDPSQFQKKLFDDLYVRYTGQKILSQVQSSSGPSATTHVASSSRYQPYQRTNDNGYSFRPSSSSKSTPSRCRCLLCGGLSHSPKTCIAATLVNGKPLLLPKSTTPDTPRTDRNGRQYCFGWNGKNGQCTFKQCVREHACSLCGDKSHNAQSCPTIL